MNALVSMLNLCPEIVAVSCEGDVSGSLSFGQWVDALNAMASIWQSRLRGAHQFTPQLVAYVTVSSDTDELVARLKAVFSDHVRELMEGESVKKWKLKEDEKSAEIAKITEELSKNNRVLRFEKLVQTKKSLVQERDSIANRIRGFKNAMRCVLRYLGEEFTEKEMEMDEFGKNTVDVFKFEGDGFDWHRIHALILRECKRFEDELPIYSYREEILNRVHWEQVYIFFFLLFIYLFCEIWNFLSF